MDAYETLIEKANIGGLEVIDYNFNSDRIKGLYSDGIAVINKKIPTVTEKKCILAEELGHYYTSTGDIINQNDVNNRKQEHRARVWSYNKMVGISGIIKALKHKCYLLHEMSTYLDVTEEFLTECINYYKSKYGLWVSIDNYTIFFEPLCVLELYK